MVMVNIYLNIDDMVNYNLLISKWMNKILGIYPGRVVLKNSKRSLSLLPPCLRSNPKMIFGFSKQKERNIP